MKQFIFQALVKTKIAEIYGFADLSMLGLNAHVWRQYASEIIKHSEKAGILMTRRTTRAHICAPVSYHCEIDLQADRVLQAATFPISIC